MAEEHEKGMECRQRRNGVVCKGEWRRNMKKEWIADREGMELHVKENGGGT
jgi:hypothetical protein